MNVSVKIKILFILCFLGLLSACSLDAQLISLDSIQNPILEKMRTEADFVAGEVVTTGNGVVVQGTFGEISEKKELSSGIQIEGVFYE